MLVSHSYMDKCLVESFAHVLIRLFVFLLLSYRSCLYVLNINSLSDISFTIKIWGFPSSLAGKKSACNAGDPSLIPESEPTGEGIGCPLQCSWASLVVQLVKNPPAMWETWV